MPSVTTSFQWTSDHMKKPWSLPNEPTTDPLGSLRAGKPKKAIERAQYSDSAATDPRRVSRKRTERKRRKKGAGGPWAARYPVLAAYS
jgi:hypothetical protein